MAVLNLISFKLSRKEKLSLLSVVSVVCCVFYFIFQSFALLGATIAIVFCIFIKTRRITQSIVIAILAVMSSVISDTIVYYFKISFTNTGTVIDKSNSSYLFMYLCIAIITFIISKILGILLNKKLNISILDLKGKSAVLIILSLVVTFAIFIANIIIGQQNGFTSESVQINLILFTMYFVILLFIMFVLISNIKKEMQFESTKMNLKT